MAEEDKAPETPAYVTKDQLAETLNGVIDRIQGFINVAAAETRTAPPPVAALPQPTIDLDDLDTTIKEGASGGASKIDKLVQARVAEALGKFEQTNVSPLRTVGLNNLEAIAKRTTLNGLEHSKRFEKEIDAFMRDCTPDIRANPDGWREAYNIVLGRHHEELKREAVETAIRQETSKPPAPSPSSAGAFLDDEMKVPVPTPEELLGPEARELMKIKGAKTPDELVKGMGYASWKDYVRMAREWDLERQYDADNPNNLYHNSPKGVRRYARI
jgi:hypothetical protein